MKPVISFFSSILFFLLTNVGLLSPTFAQYHHPQQMIAEIKHSKNPGQQVFKHYCAMCHSEKPMINLGAPRIGIKADWQHRPFHTRKQIPKMLDRMDKGLGAMPPRGGCFECDDKLLKQAIEYMLPER